MRSLDIFLQLTKRHLLVFFRNKIRMFYTLMVPVIIFVVYIFFLREMELEMIWSSLPAGMERTQELASYFGTLVDSWMLSGITALSVITVSLQTNNVLVEDKQSGVNRDFISSPIPQSLLIGSYFLFNFLVTAVICLIFLVICGLYLVCLGEFMLTFANVLTIFAVLLYITVATTLMTVFIASFVKKEATMSSIVAIFSTAVGFLIGAYMPFGMLPAGMQWVQNICVFIPGTHACSLLRYAFLDTPMRAFSAYVQGLGIEGSAAAVEGVFREFGYDLRFFGLTVTPPLQALVLAGCILLFLVLNIGVGKKSAEVLGLGRKKKK